MRGQEVLLQMHLAKWGLKQMSIPTLNGTCTVVLRGEYPWRARPPLPYSVPDEVRESGLVTTEPYLLKAAQLLTSKGCGEGWLLQPHIVDMPDMEYRSVGTT